MIEGLSESKVKKLIEMGEGGGERRISGWKWEMRGKREGGGGDYCIGQEYS